MQGKAVDGADQFCPLHTGWGLSDLGKGCTLSVNYPAFESRYHNLLDLGLKGGGGFKDTHSRSRKASQGTQGQS